MENYTENIQLVSEHPEECIVGENNKLKIFISYSHLDNHSENSHIERFKKHIDPFKSNGLIEEWYDRKILSGEDYQNKIDDNLKDADIICLFISANFLFSENCMDEKKKALKLRKDRGVPVIPIIVSPCGWKENKKISRLLVLPTDGNPVSTFNDRDEAWQDVCSGLKKVIEKEIKIRQLEIKDEFNKFLHSSEMLEKAHNQKESVYLDNIFIYPELDKYDNLEEHKEKISSKELLNNISDYPKIVITGEDLSGKTTFCKMIFNELRVRNLIPVYISGKKTSSSGKIKNKISDSLREQYKNVDINNIDNERIIPIIDDFHHAINKEKDIIDLSTYSRCIITVDDIFSLNIEDEKLVSSFTSFRIKELKPSLRYELVKKWEILSDNDLDNYQKIDKNIGLIDSTLGKSIGKGIMPAYPFFILSTIVTYETFATPLDQEITSHGYCYQAFIYFYLRKVGVQNDEIDIYINFLTEFAFYIYKEEKDELTHYDFTLFMESYLDKYNLPIKPEILLKNLSQIVSEDSFKNYSFRYPYFHYFFVAKYLAEHIEDEEVTEEIHKIITNLHLDENAYIAVFITHHSKKNTILDEIERNALSLFEKYKPITLTKDEMKFFDEQADIIVNAVMPPANMTPEKSRKQRLRIQDEVEQSQKDIEQEDDDEEDSLGMELRRAIKTVEVMGCIIKNRAGSLEKVKLEKIFMDAMNIHLRLLSHFVELIRSEKEQNLVFDFISDRLSALDENKGLGKDELNKNAKIIFWNLNFCVISGIIYKIVHSLGSDKLTEIVNNVCDDVNTPATLSIKYGILMEYNKNILIKELTKRINEKDFSEVAKRTTKLMVVNHCSLHPIKYQDRQRIASLLNVSEKKLLPIGSK